MADVFKMVRTDIEGRLRFLQPHEVRVARMIMADLAGRDALGWETYGGPMVHDDGRDWSVQAYQEILDAITYVRADIEKRGTRKLLPMYSGLLSYAIQLRSEIDG